MNRSWHLSLGAFAVCLICACSSVRQWEDRTLTSRITSDTPQDATVQHGVASYYGVSHDGKRTASGETFNKNEMTAAHRKLPFGTRVKVTNQKNKREVVVRINDRGPYAKGTIIDVSEGAARKLEMIDDGMVQVEIVVLDR